MKPLLSSDRLVCFHNGVVQFQQTNGKELEVLGGGVITESNLKNAVIVGCSHNIVGIPKPCTKIMQIPPNALSELIEVNGEKVVLEDNVNKILTDNGVPLQLQVHHEKPITISN